MPIWRSMFSILFFEFVKYWRCYESIQKQYYAIQIIYLLSFFSKQHMKQTTSEEILTKSIFLLRDVYITNCYFHIFCCHFTLKSTFFKPIAFKDPWESYQRISWGYLQYIPFYLKNNIFHLFWNVSIKFNVQHIKRDRQNFLSFWAIFCLFTSLTTQKIKLLKKWKKILKILSFYTWVP